MKNDSEVRVVRMRIEPCRSVILKDTVGFFVSRCREGKVVWKENLVDDSLVGMVCVSFSGQVATF